MHQVGKGVKTMHQADRVGVRTTQKIVGGIGPCIRFVGGVVRVLHPVGVIVYLFVSVI